MMEPTTFSKQQTFALPSIRKPIWIRLAAVILLAAGFGCARHTQVIHYHGVVQQITRYSRPLESTPPPEDIPIPEPPGPPVIQPEFVEERTPPPRHQTTETERIKLPLPPEIQPEFVEERTPPPQQQTTRTERINRIPHIDSEAGERVKPGADISVTVYADSAPRHENEEHIAPVKLEVPAQTQDVPVTVYLLVSEEFSLKGAESKKLVIHKNPKIVDKVTFDLKVEDRTAGRTGAVTALFFHQGYPCGRVTHFIRISYSDSADNRNKTAATAPLPGGTRFEGDDAIAVTRDGPDMTIVVIKTDLGRYQYFVIAPDSKDPLGQVDNWSNYSDPQSPQQILESYYGLFGRAYPPQNSRNSLFDLGEQLYDKAPVGVKKVIRELIEHKKEPKTILIFSDEPYFAWELMIPHWDGRDESESFPLGVTSAVARWGADSKETFHSPVRHIPIGSSVYFAPAYVVDALKTSEEEQGWFAKLMQGTPIDPPTYQQLCDLSTSDEVTVLHFICHGQSDKDHPGLQEIWGEPQKRTTQPVEETLEGEDPPPQSYQYEANFQPGSLIRCQGFKRFCSKHPLVFLNACQVGGTIQTMTSAGGFGPTFIKMEAGGVVAPLWSVFDDTANSAAKEFYETLRNEPQMPIAEIVQQIRKKAYTGELADGLATYAAYCFYGDPLAVPTFIPQKP